MTSMAVEHDDLNALLEAYRAGDDSARDRIVERYLPLVRSLASRYSGRGEAFEDLVQVGSIGLLLAIDRFDTERGVQFATYAVPTIVGEIQRHFRDRTWALHVPRRMKELSLRLTRTIESATADLGRAPTIAELAELTGIDEDEVVEALETYHAYSARSLSQPLGADASGEETMQDVLGAEEMGYEEVEDGALVEAGMAALDERERLIVQLRFFDGLTQSEIAARVGISQMHVSRLLRRALVTMQGRLEENALEREDEG
jgi:RNA polymerase sigma-B factor